MASSLLALKKDKERSRRGPYRSSRKSSSKVQGLKKEHPDRENQGSVGGKDWNNSRIGANGNIFSSKNIIFPLNSFSAPIATTAIPESQKMPMPICYPIPERPYSLDPQFFRQQQLLALKMPCCSFMAPQQPSAFSHSESSAFSRQQSRPILQEEYFFEFSFE